MKTIIILPTYNEAENIEKFINCILQKVPELAQAGFDVSILVVDDNSPDGTGEIVKKIMANEEKVNLLTGTKRGLGKAYIKGFKYAIQNFAPDILMEMDSDFSHSPDDLLKLLKPLLLNNEVVIGSRYIAGGSIPQNWALIRKLISRYGNIFSRYIAGITNIKDCTSGFRAIKTSIINQVDLDSINANGYSFQMNLLYNFVRLNAKIVEVPINFIDREYGKSKLGVKDIAEFIINAVKIRTQRIICNLSNH